MILVNIRPLTAVRVLCIATVWALASCGGGGGGDSDSTSGTDGGGGVLAQESGADNGDDTTAGGSGGTGNPNELPVTEESAPAFTSLTLFWDVPRRRENGALLRGDLQGFVVLCIPEDEVEFLLTELLGGEVSLSDFINAGADLSQYISGEDIATLVPLGFPGITVLPEPNSNGMVLEDMSPGTYYLAVSAFDYLNIYGDPTSLVSITIP